MTTQPVICIVTAAARVSANLVWAAMGRGPDTFSRRLTTDDPATTSSTVTHCLMADGSATVEDVDAWQDLNENGALPDIEGEWGVDGVIASADAIDATNATNLEILPVPENKTSLEYANEVLGARGLSFVPDEL